MAKNKSMNSEAALKSHCLDCVVSINYFLDRSEELARRTREHGWQTVGGVMRKLREEKGTSLRSLAKNMEISPVFLSDMERGNRRYSIEWAKKAMEFLFC